MRWALARLRAPRPGGRGAWQTLVRLRARRLVGGGARWALVGLLLTACSNTVTRPPSGDRPERPRDAAIPLDSGAMTDAADSDAAPPPDSGADDAGMTSEDATTPADTGVGSDTGAPADTGVPADTGIPGDTGAASDAGLTQDAGQDCTFGLSAPPARLDPRQTLDASRLQALRDCAANDPVRANTFVDGFVAELLGEGAGGAPWANGRAQVFYRGDASRLTVSGAFDSWPEPGTRTFSQIAGTDLHVAEIPVAADGRTQYKLTRARVGGGVEWFTNPLGRWLRWDGIDQQTVGDFNNELVGPQYVVTSSFVHARTIARRPVYVQLPVAYYTSMAPMGVLYVHDGNEMLTRSDMQSVVDATIAANRSQAVAVAYVALEDQSQRNSEYTYGAGTSGDAYIDALADIIAPAVEAHIPTAAMPDNRGLAGASLGGLISFHGAWRRNDAFRLVGAQSPSLWFDTSEMVARVQSQMMVDARIYLDSGNPGDNFDSTQAMADVLQARGYTYQHIVEPGGRHEWSFWAGRFDELLAFLYPVP